MADSFAETVCFCRSTARSGQQRRRASGLTLIELLTVIFVIGILLVIALPTFMNYLSRAKTSEAFSIVAPVRRAVDEYWAINGQLPDSSAQAAVGPQTDYAGQHVRGIQVIEDGVIRIEMFASGHIVFTPSTGDDRQTLIWACSSADIAPQHLPSECRQ